MSCRISGVPRMTQTMRFVRALMGRKAASARSAPPGVLFPRRRKRKGAHLFMEPKATTRPRGRAKSSVRKKSLAASPQPCRMERVTVQNMGHSPSKA